MWRIGVRSCVSTGAAVLMLVGPVASAGARHIVAPPAAKAWIGTWRTNEGTFRFNEVYNCQLGRQFPGGEAGKPGGACALDGEWRHGGGDWRVIHGFVALGPKYRGESWEGCFRTPDYLPGHECSFNGGGSMLLFRATDRFTGGYWKACGLGAACESHHPIRGSKVSNYGGHEPVCPAPAGATERVFDTGAACPDYTVNVLAHVDGFPDSPLPGGLPSDLASVEVQSFGVTLTWSPKTRQWTGEGDITMTDTYVDQGQSPPIDDKQVTITLAGTAAYNIVGDTRKVAMDVTVARSEDPNCPAGADIAVFALTRPDHDAFAIAQYAQPNCLSRLPVLWEAHRINKATISRPVVAS